jgi:hypothetical protein
MKIVTTLLIAVFMFVFPMQAEAVRCIAKDGVTITEADVCPANQAQVAEFSDLEELFGSIIMVAGLLLTFGFFVMMIIGGLRYLLSGGDPKALQAAKGTITWAIIGLAFFALSFTILLILEAFTGVDLGVFKLSGF